MGATEKIAQFIVDTRYEGIPRDVVEKAKRTALDCIGAALAGVGEPVSQTITDYVSRLSSPSQASVFGAAQSFGCRCCSRQRHYRSRAGL